MVAVITGGREGSIPACGRGGPYRARYLAPSDTCRLVSGSQIGAGSEIIFLVSFRMEEARRRKGIWHLVVNTALFITGANLQGLFVVLGP